MSVNDTLRDPCEIIIDEQSGDPTGGSSVAPVIEETLEDYEGTEPIFPENEAPEIITIPHSEYDNIGSILEGYRRNIYMLDTSNFYEGSTYRNFGLGFRTPAELDISVQAPISNVNSAGPINIRASAGSQPGMRSLVQESQLQQSEENDLDLPPRDILRHMLGKVWTQYNINTTDNKLSIESSLRYKNKIFSTQIQNDFGEKINFYDYTTRDGKYNNNQIQPFILYLWSETGFGQNTPDSILKNYKTDLGLRFHRHTLKRLMSFAPEFWQLNRLSPGSIETSLDFNSEMIRDILDLWVLGPKSNPGGSAFVSAKKNWLINENVFFEDTVFTAPSSFDVREFGDLKLDTPKPNLIQINSKMDLSNRISSVDRQNLSSRLNQGLINIDDLPNQPYEVTPVENANIYSYISNRDSDNPQENYINSTTPIQKFSADHVRAIESLDLKNSNDQNVNEILKQHVEINFERHESEIAKILDDNNLDALTLDIFHHASHTKETFTQIIDNDQIGYNLAAEGKRDPTSSELIATAANRDRISRYTTPKKVKDFAYKFEQHHNLLTENEEYFLNTDLEYPFRETLDTRYTKDSGLFMAKKSTAFSLLKEHLKHKSRSFGSILSGRKAYSEVVGYKIVKKLVPTGEEIQTFYIFNEQKGFNEDTVKPLSFIDTQVVQRQSYEYSVFTINAVVGSEYRYKATGILQENNTRLSYDPKYETNGPAAKHHIRYTFKDFTEEYYRSTVSVTNHLHLIEVPYYQEVITLGDLPPTRPNITFIPELGIDDSFTILFQQNLGSVVENIPVPILQTDIPVIQKMVENQLTASSQSQKITYSSVSRPLIYEVMIVDTPPSKYSNFAKANILKTDFRTPFMKFKININKSYYMIARSVDRSGISNPTEVFKVRIESHEDGINPIFERYDMSQTHAFSEITFQNIISISPTLEQTQVDFSRVTNNDEESFFSTAPSLNLLELGASDMKAKKIWGKKFKFRFKSKYSEKSIDINVDFTKSKDKRSRQQLSTQSNIEAGMSLNSEITYQDLRTDQRYRYESDTFAEAQLDTTEPQTGDPGLATFVDRENLLNTEISEIADGVLDAVETQFADSFTDLYTNVGTGPGFRDYGVIFENDILGPIGSSDVIFENDILGRQGPPELDIQITVPGFTGQSATQTLPIDNNIIPGTGITTVSLANTEIQNTNLMQQNANIQLDQAPLPVQSSIGASAAPLEISVVSSSGVVTSLSEETEKVENDLSSENLNVSQITSVAGGLMNRVTPQAINNINTQARTRMTSRNMQQNRSQTPRQAPRSNNLPQTPRFRY